MNHKSLYATGLSAMDFALRATPIMITRPDKPPEYFAKLLDLPEDAIDYTDIPPTKMSEWQMPRFSSR